jgi:hypothetical protein
MVRVPLMNLFLRQTARRQAGISLIEIIGSVIILTITIIGVAQYLFVAKTLAYHTNIKNAVLLFLNDTVTEQQTCPVGTNYISAPADLALFIPDGTVRLVKVSTNITGTLVWISTLSQDDPAARFTNTISLDLIPPP